METPLSQTTESSQGSGFRAQSQALEDLRRRLSDPAQAAEAAEMLRQTNVLSWLAAAPEFGAFVRSCAAAGRADVLERAALAAPGCVDAADARGRTALHSAARNGHLVMLNRLLDWGADPRAVTRNGNSCLHAVAKRSVVPHSRRAHHPPQSAAAEVLDAIRAKATAAAAYVQHRLSSSSSTPASPAIAEESAAAAPASAAIEDWEEDDDDEDSSSSSASPAPQLSFVRSWSTSMVRFPLSPARTRSEEHPQEDEDDGGDDGGNDEESGSKESRRIEQLDSEGALADAKPKLEELIHFTVHRLCKVLDASAPNRAGWTPLRLAIDRGNEPVAASLRECGAKLGDEPVAVSGGKCCGGEGVDIVEVQHEEEADEAAPAVQQETEAAKAISAATASIAKFAQSVAVQGQGIVRRLRTSQKTMFLNKVREILDSEPRRRPFSRVPDPFPSSTGASASAGAGAGAGAESQDRTRKYRIIALDGGGVRCVMHCILLARIARQFPSFLENTEMLCGCSGASVLPVLLQCGLSVEQVGRLMELSAEWTLKKAAGNGITGMRFSAKWLRMMCDLIMGDLRLADLPRHVVIPAYRLDNGREGFARKGEAAFLTNAVPAAAAAGGEERAVDACLRSGSAPTYFNSYQGFVDGGIFANNPSMCGLPLAIGTRPAGLQVPVTNVVCLSLGTGRAQAERFVERHKVAGGGLAQWGTSLMDVLDAAQLDYAEVSGRALLGSRFFRLTPELQGSIKLDDVNAIPVLKAIAEKVDIAEMLSWVEQNWF